MQKGLLQFLQGGEFAFVEASEVLGVYSQVVGGLLAVFNAGIAQQADESEGQQKLSGLMQVSQLPRRWPCCEGLLDTTLPLSGRQEAAGMETDPLAACPLQGNVGCHSLQHYIVGVQVIEWLPGSPPNRMVARGQKLLIDASQVSHM